MPKTITLSPEQIHEIADSAEDEASALPPCQRRDQMLESVWRMRRQANLAQWTGIESLQAEMQDDTFPFALLW